MTDPKTFDDGNTTGGGSSSGGKGTESYDVEAAGNDVVEPARDDSNTGGGGSSSGGKGDAFPAEGED